MKWLALLLHLCCIIKVSAQPLSAADSLYKQGLYEKALAAYNEYIALHKTEQTIDFANAWLRKGTTLCSLNNFDDALPCYFTALKLYEKLSNQERISTANKNIGFVYTIKENYSLAENYYSKAYEGFKIINDSTQVAALLIDLSAISLSKKDSGKSISLLYEALRCYEHSVPPSLKWNIFNSLAINFTNSKPDSCIYYYHAAENLAILENDTTLLLTTYINISDAYLKQHVYTEALLYLKKCLFFINERQYGDANNLSVAYHNLAEAYYFLNQYKPAYEYSIKEMDVNDSLYRISQSNIASELSEKYESAKKDEKIRIQQVESKLKSRNLALSLAGAGLATALAIISFISFHRKRKANQLLLYQKDKIEKLNAELDASNQTKSKLFSVISHDLRSPVSSLYAYLQLKNKYTEENDEAALQQTEQLLDTLEDLLVWSKSQLHQFIPSIEKINIKSLVEQVKVLLIASAHTKNIGLINNISGNLIIQSDINMLTIILRNILSNAIKYSPAHTNVCINAAMKDTLQLFISNEAIVTGNNFSLAENITSNKSGLGISLMMEFAQKLGGTFVYDVENNKKVTAIVTLPQSL